jgi:hypothetical protein
MSIFDTIKKTKQKNQPDVQITQTSEGIVQSSNPSKKKKGKKALTIFLIIVGAFFVLCLVSILTTPKEYSDGIAMGEKTGYDNGYKEGYEVGKTEGYESGKTEGYESGKTEGYESGKTEGYESGKTDGYTVGLNEGLSSAAAVNAVTNEAVTSAQEQPEPIIDPEKGEEADATKKKEDAAKKEEESPKLKPDISVSVKKILQEFEDNELAADEKYKGKIIEVTGIVNKVDTDRHLFSEDEYLLYLVGDEYSWTNVSCYGLPNEVLAELTSGDKVTVIGKFYDGGDLGVILKECQFPENK